MKTNHTIIQLSKITGTEAFLTGNTLGREVLHKLQVEVDAYPETIIFGISLKGIHATDASFPRESVISLIKMLSGEKGFFLQDFSSADLCDNWDYAAKAKNQSVIIYEPKQKYQVIGPELNEGAKELLDYVIKEELVTTSKVAQKFAISVPNASARMKKLLQSGLVLGTKENAETGGLEFVYTAIK